MIAPSTTRNRMNLGTLARLASVERTNRRVVAAYRRGHSAGWCKGFLCCVALDGLGALVGVAVWWWRWT